MWKEAGSPGVYVERLTQIGQGSPILFGKGPQLLLGAGLRAARKKSQYLVYPTA